MIKNKFKDNIYLKNKDLYEEIVKSKGQGKLTTPAQNMLILLTTRVSRRMQYKNPEDRKDCMSFAHLDLLKYWNSFDPEKSKNAFAYYTEIIKKGFAKGWNTIYPKKYAGTFSLDGGDNAEIYSI